MNQMTTDELKQAASMLLTRQGNDKPSVTVREAGVIWHIEPSAALHRLRRLVLFGLAEQTQRGHYHIKDQA